MGSDAVAGSRFDAEGEIEVVMSEARRRKSAVCWTAGRGVLGRVVVRKEVSQALEAGRCFERR